MMHTKSSKDCHGLCWITRENALRECSCTVSGFLQAKTQRPEAPSGLSLGGLVRLPQMQALP